MSRRITDLTMTIHEGMQTFAAHWHPFVEITQLGRHGIENRETRKITLGTHTGTHIDAARHFLAGGWTVDTIAPDQLIGRASVLDFSHLQDFHEISAAELFDTVAGRTTERVIFRYDWHKRLMTNAYFSDHPFLSEEACVWLMEQGCRMVALDAPQPDNPKNGRHSAKDAPNHKVLLGGGAVIVEYLVDLDKVSSPEVELIVAPLKILDGDGAPARVFAIEE